MAPPLFSLGQVVATPGALRALEDAGQSTDEFLNRHLSGDWGNLSEQDRKENDFSLIYDYRILSVYILRSGIKIWIITEADRSSTTILLPEEY